MKLSKGVLGLKFMRKTRDQLEQTETEKKHRKYFQGDAASVKSEAASTSTAQATVRVCPSYSQVERFTYARQSYGGMNPTVEENIRKGVWKMEYEISDDDAEETGKKSIKKEPTEEGEISDEYNSEDDLNSPVFGSIIGTIGKRFNRKMKFKRPHDDVQDNLDEASVAPPKKRKKNNNSDSVPRWKKTKKNDQTRVKQEKND